MAGEKSKPAASAKPFGARKTRFKPKARAPRYRSLIAAEVFEREFGVFQNLEKQTLGKITGVNGNHERFSSGMFQNQVRAGLTRFAIAVTDEESNEFASGNHSVHRECDGFRVNGAGGGNGLAFLATVLNIDAHSLQNAFLGLLDGLAETIDAREVVTIGVVTLAFAFDGYGIAVEGHCTSSLP